MAAPQNSDSEFPGQWYSFDEPVEKLRRGLVNISVGRDTVDTSMMTFFGATQLIEQSVSVQESE